MLFSVALIIEVIDIQNPTFASITPELLSNIMTHENDRFNLEWVIWRYLKPNLVRVTW